MPKQGTKPFRRKGRDIWYVWHHGKQIPLGKDRDEAFRRWHELSLEPDPRPVPRPTLVADVEPPESCWTVAELADAYERFAATEYVKNGQPTSQLAIVRNALHRLVSVCGRLSIDSLGPKRIRLVQNRMIHEGISRGYINAMTGVYKSMLRWGLEEELIEGSKGNNAILAKGVCRLRKNGKHRARETPPVPPIPQEHVDAIQPFVSRTLWGMIQFQLLTGARPGEVRGLTGGQIDKSGDVWEYRPTSHKTEHHGKERVVMIGPKAQELLSEFLTDDPDAYVFSADGDGERPYRRDSYRNAIARACERAFGMSKELRHIQTVVRKLKPAERTIELARLKRLAREWRDANCWHPNQLRHNFATTARAGGRGIEAARVTLGHSSSVTSEIYAEADMEAARRIVAQIG